ncbi:MAG TPA: hypothetical protein PKC76_18750 [Saprospiraceae bacterium]|nr:hypothetical protein [Saprospiraceae bacterium]HMP26175.1 hypothetical protein [Saprospiraceae bacterium]
MKKVFFCLIVLMTLGAGISFACQGVITVCLSEYPAYEQEARENCPDEGAAIEWDVVDDC